MEVVSGAVPDFVTPFYGDLSYLHLFQEQHVLLSTLGMPVKKAPTLLRGRHEPT